MITKLKRTLHAFRREEKGSALLIEFCIFVPLLFSTFLMAVEMGMYSMRQMYLDRGLDIAVRHIRLNTNTAMTHDGIKDIICENAGFIEDCDTTLRLEMKTLDPRDFTAIPAPADCVDTSEPIQPVRGFTLGMEHQLMLVRACVKFDPVFPTSGLGYAFDEDGSGQARMLSNAAFVQEPN